MYVPKMNAHLFDYESVQPLKQKYQSQVAVIGLNRIKIVPNNRGGKLGKGAHGEVYLGFYDPEDGGKQVKSEAKD